MRKIRKVSILMVALAVAATLVVPAGAHLQKESDPKGDMGDPSLDIVQVQAKETKKVLVFKVKLAGKVKKSEFESDPFQPGGLHNVTVSFNEQSSDPEKKPYVYSVDAATGTFFSSESHQVKVNFKKKKKMVIFKIKREWLDAGAEWDAQEDNDLKKGDVMEWWVDAVSGDDWDRAPDDDATPWKFTHDLQK